MIDPRPAPAPASNPAPVHRIRSYAAQRARNSALTRQRMDTFLPQRRLPDGPVDALSSFGRPGPLVLEIGCGHGAAAIAYCQAHPGHHLIAMDVHTPGLARMMAAADEAGEPNPRVPNLRVAHGDAVVLLEERVAPASLHAVHLFFPDPWPKQKHARRRFVTQHTLALVHSRLEAGHALLVATDQDFYAEHVLEQLARHGGFAVSTGERPGWRPTDGFEAKGVGAGRSISEIRAVSV